MELKTNTTGSERVVCSAFRWSHALLVIVHVVRDPVGGNMWRQESAAEGTSKGLRSIRSAIAGIISAEDGSYVSVNG